MKKMIFLFFLLSNTAWALQSSSSFYIEIREQKFRVESPDEKNLKSLPGLKNDPAGFKVSIVFDNKGLDKIYGELKTDEKVLKRFVLLPSQTKTIEVKEKYIGKLYFVPISPPFQAIPLKYSQGIYEIPPTPKEK